MTRLRLRPLLALAWVALLGWCAPAWAHKPSDSYLTLTVQDQRVEGQWDIALRDLDFVLALDADGNGELTWDEVRAKHADIAAYALSRLALAGDGAACAAKVTSHLIDDHTDGAYAVLRFTANCTQTIAQLEVHYSLLFDVDPQHKGLLNLRHGSTALAAIFSPDTARQQFKLREPDRLAQFANYLKTGVWHIWLGFDHILFLLSLLLPAVLVWSGRAWQPAPGLRGAFVEVVKVVTAFTAAHSITLSLATLQVVALPSRWVESVIALSVLLAALNNIWPTVVARRWAVAFGFGLVHGFGFASVLSDLALPRAALALALVGFNLGVELGQLAIVALFLPLAFWARGHWLYRTLLLVAGSALVALLATVWMVERAFNFRLL